LRWTRNDGSRESPGRRPGSGLVDAEESRSRKLATDRPIDLLGQRSGDVVLKGVVEVRRSKLPIDRDEQVPDLGSIFFYKETNGDPGAHLKLPKIDHTAKDDLYRAGLV
jgi:hypothetical protein